MSELTVTPASEFRKMRLYGVQLALYTGRAIRMRCVDPSHFVKELEGTPLLFQQFILDAFWEGDYRTEVDKFLAKRTSPSETADVATALGIVAKKAMLKPRVVDVPQTDDGAAPAVGDEDEEIALSDFQVGELVWIFRLAFEPRQVLYFLEEHGLASTGEDDTEDVAATKET
jgi:hypothetical protein